LLTESTDPEDQSTWNYREESPSTSYRNK